MQVKLGKLIKIKYGRCSLRGQLRTFAFIGKLVFHSFIKISSYLVVLKYLRHCVYLVKCLIIYHPQPHLIQNGLNNFMIVEMQLYQSTSRRWSCNEVRAPCDS